MRSTITAIAFFLWFILGFFYYQSCVECCHAESAKSPITIAPILEKPQGPILFSWGKSTPITEDSWTELRQGYIDNISENEKLEITGYYRKDEVNSSTYDNLGLARAHETAQLFTPPLNEDQITKISKLVTGEVDRSTLYESVDFNNRIVSKKIQEVGDKTTIYFPYNSTNKLDEGEVEDYLNKIAKRIKESGERVQLTGHTDNKGSEIANERLGQQRANIIRDYLVAKGVPKSKVITLSRGESTPVATNDTKEGRALNRRTVLTTIK